MNAIVCTKYGPPEVLEYRVVPTPKPKANEIMVKVIAVPATVGDCRIRGLRVPPSFELLAKIALGFKRPRKAILGRYFAGVVDSIGNKVTQFKIGDNVFGSTGNKLSTYAEFVCVSEKESITTIPEKFSFEQAAACLWGNGTALHFLRKTDTHRKQHILVNGASGSVGLGAVQLSKYFGFTVTGVCSSKNIDLVKSAGADYVIDYNRENFVDNDKTFDIIFDTVGNQPVQKLINVLKTDGLLLHAVASPDVVREMRKQIKGTQKKFVGGTFKWNKEMISFIKQRLENNDLKPIIDSTYSFDEIVIAHYRVDSGRKTGDVIVTIDKNSLTPDSLSNRKFRVGDVTV
jgi:NADPH:quinone reductase-like Zn-dependent oxidoreductase